MTLWPLQSSSATNFEKRREEKFSHNSFWTLCWFLVLEFRSILESFETLVLWIIYSYKYFIIYRFSWIMISLCTFSYYYKIILFILLHSPLQSPPNQCFGIIHYCIIKYWWFLSLSLIHAMIIVIKYTCIVNNWFLRESWKSLNTRWISSLNFIQQRVKYTSTMHIILILGENGKKLKTL